MYYARTWFRIFDTDWIFSFCFVEKAKLAAVVDTTIFLIVCPYRGVIGFSPTILLAVAVPTQMVDEYCTMLGFHEVTNTTAPYRRVSGYVDCWQGSRLRVSSWRLLLTQNWSTDGCFSWVMKTARWCTYASDFIKMKLHRRPCRRVSGRPVNYDWMFSWLTSYIYNGRAYRVYTIQLDLP